MKHFSSHLSQGTSQIWTLYLARRPGWLSAISAGRTSTKAISTSVLLPLEQLVPLAEDKKAHSLPSDCPLAMLCKENVILPLENLVLAKKASSPVLTLSRMGPVPEISFTPSLCLNQNPSTVAAAAAVSGKTDGDLSSRAFIMDKILYAEAFKRGHLHSIPNRRLGNYIKFLHELAQASRGSNTAQLFSTAVISGSSSAPDLKEMKHHQLGFQGTGKDTIYGSAWPIHSHGRSVLITIFTRIVRPYIGLQKLSAKHIFTTGRVDQWRLQSCYI